MMSRGGFPAKNIAYGVFIVALIYLLFIYNGSQKRLRDAEMIGARYKREAEERVAEIQDLIRAKDKFQESCQNEKHELNNRIKSINQQHSMLQSQYKETEADFSKLKQDMDNLKAEHALVKDQHVQEFHSLKQTKENEITQLKDQIADMTRRYQALMNQTKLLENQILKDQVQLQNEQAKADVLEGNFIALKAAQKNLMEDNLRLQQSQRLQANNNNNNIVNNNNNLNNNFLQQQQQQQQQGNVNQDQLFGRNDGHGFVKNMNIENSFKVKNNQPQGQFGNVGQGIGSLNFGDHGLERNVDTLGKEIDQAIPRVEDINRHHQVQPPDSINNNINSNINNNNINKDDSIHFGGGAGLEKNEHGERPEVNPNDEQKGQIMEPIFDGGDKNRGGGEDGVDRMNVRKEEEERERGVRKEEEQEGRLLERNKPLDLVQMNGPGDMNEYKGVGDNPLDADADEEKQMPKMLDENDHNMHEQEEHQFFGEDEGQRLDEEQQQEEDERELREGDDMENDSQLGDDFGNHENNDAALDDAQNN